MFRLIVVAFLLISFTGCSVSVQKQEPTISGATETQPSASIKSASQAIATSIPINEKSQTSAMKRLQNKIEGSRATSINKESAIWLRVSKSFGTETIDQLKEHSLALNTSLLDWMRDRLPIETAYGGSFVDSIHGISSGFTDQGLFSRKQIDWFFYVNGQLSPIGAADVIVRPGDRIIWDYHEWDSGNPAQSEIIGAFPQPFSGVNANQDIKIKTTESFAKTKRDSLQLFQSWLASQTDRKNKIEKISANPKFDDAQLVPEIWILDSKTASSISDLKDLLNGSSNSPFIYTKLPDKETRAWIQAIRSVDPNAMPVWLVILNEEGDFDQLFELIKKTELWQGWFGLRIVASKSKSALKPITYAPQEEATQ